MQEKNKKRSTRKYYVDSGFNPINYPTSQQVSLVSFTHLQYWIKKDNTDVDITITQQDGFKEEKQKDWNLRNSKFDLLKEIRTLIKEKLKNELGLSLKEFKELRTQCKKLKEESISKTAFITLDKTKKLIEIKEKLKPLRDLIKKTNTFVNKTQHFLFNENLDLLFDKNGHAIKYKGVLKESEKQLNCYSLPKEMQKKKTMERIPQNNNNKRKIDTITPSHATNANTLFATKSSKPVDLNQNQSKKVKMNNTGTEKQIVHKILIRYHNPLNRVHKNEEPVNKHAISFLLNK